MRPEARQPDPRWRALAGIFQGTAWEDDAPGDDAALPDPLATRLRAAATCHLESEYVRLFVNALPEVPCPPYASVYLEGGLHGATTARVRDLYRRWGVDSHDMPDHFAVEAAFVAALRPAAATDAAAARDLAWLHAHLRTWAPAFLAAVRRHDRTGAFAAAADWAETLLEELGEPLDDTLSAPSDPH